MSTQNYLPLWNKKKKKIIENTHAIQQRKLNSKNSEWKNAKCSMYSSRKKRETTQKKKKNKKEHTFMHIVFDIARQTEIFTFYNSLHFYFEFSVHCFVRFLKNLKTTMCLLFTHHALFTARFY